MRQPPTGTVTFLFTDIEGSTRLWESHPEAMRPALARHDALLRQVVTQHGGYVFKTVGDAFCAAFPTAPEALAAALAAQVALAAEPWPASVPIRLRMALHTGSTEERDGDYFGPPLNRVARLLAAGHGGQTLLSLAAQELTRDALPASASLLDLGAHRLRDLGRPETVFQLLHPSLPAEFPALRSLDSPALPNNLPQQTTSFIGRDAQVAEVKALLGRTRLLTLTGAGGSGKTRLALQVAADLLDGAGDGVWLVELAPLSDPALVPQAVAGVLGIQEQAGKTVQEALVEWLRPKRLLIVLDNCEHLVAACASLASDLLRNCPGVHILATSRESLNVAGEQTFRVPSLSLPDPNAKRAQTAEALSQYEAVRLFIERAQAVQASFTVTNANAPAVAQVCFHLDGIPLAIELAAARVRSLSAEEISRRLDQRFRLLTGGARDTLPRQQTLRALIDWSWDLLNEQEKALLSRLSVFAGGWTLEAAERVCAGGPVDDWEVLDLLTALVDKSLAVAEPWGEGTRYGLLETVRQYAEERLAEGGGADWARGRHASWALALAVEAARKLTGPEQLSWFSRLEAEHDNLRAALGWCEQGVDNRAQEGLRLAGMLSGFWALRGYLSEGRQWLARALAGTARLADTAEPGDTDGRAALTARARALNGAANLASNQGDHGMARALYEEVLAIAKQIGDLGYLATAFINLGCLADIQGDFGAARAHYEESMALAKQIGNPHGVAAALVCLGGVAANQGDFGAARALYEESLTIWRPLGDLHGIANSLSGLGYVASSQADYAVARALYEEGLAIRRQIGDPQGIANSLSGLGYVATNEGDFGAARVHYEESLAIRRQLGAQQGIAAALDGLGGVARAEARLSEAHGYLTESLLLKRQLGTPWITLYTLEEIAALALAQGDAGRAARLAGAAQAGREALSAPLLPEHGDTHERTLAGARGALGEEAFAAAWDAGRAMSLDHAAAYALGEE